MLIAGPGRMGSVIAAGLRAAALAVTGPVGRDADWAGLVGAGADVVLLCVPDRAIAGLATRVPPGPLLGHVSGACGLDGLGGRRGFSLHPLMTVAPGDDPGRLRGAGAAVEASDAESLAVARELAAALGLHPVPVAPADRVAYHAAASAAANLLLAVEDLADRLAASAGLARAELAPLVHAATENWSARGARAALTGPIARGDEATVRAQRAAVAERLPGDLALWDALVTATRSLAAGEAPC